MKTNQPSKRRPRAGLIGLAGALLLCVPATSTAQQVAIGTYPAGEANTYPASIINGPDGALWFAQLFYIGRISTTGAMTEFTLPGTNTANAIAAGPDGAIWFTGDNAVGRMTTAGVVTLSINLPTANSGPAGITAGPDGALWFCEKQSNKIGRITTTGSLTEYPLPTAGSEPSYIARGPGNTLWFTEGRGAIGRLTTTTGAIAEYFPPTADSAPTDIVSGPDGAMWFTEGAGKIGRLTTTGGHITEFTLPPNSGAPWGITNGPDGALWFTAGSSSGSGQLGRITTTGTITESPVPNVGLFYNYYAEIVTGPDGNLWFTGTWDNVVCEAFLVTANLSVTPSLASYHSHLAFTGSGFAPNEVVNIFTSGVGSTVLASGTTDGSGSLTVSAQANQAPYGPRTFISQGKTSGKLAGAILTTKAKLILSPSSGPVGTTFTVTGYGFEQFDAFGLTWVNPGVGIGSVAVNAEGTFNGSSTLTFTVPAGSAPGPHKVVATNSYAPAAATFTVQ